MTTPSFRSQIADSVSLPLRIFARSLAEGLFSGAHRASTKGAGIEFAGHRPYTPGDDLRHLDRHAQLRHNRLLLRQFQTDTERSIHIVCDVSPSMAYADADPPSPSKLDTALLMTASLAYYCRRAGDDLGVTLIDGKSEETLVTRGRGASLDQIISTLEANQRPPLAPTVPQTSAAGQADAGAALSLWQKTLHVLGGSLRRGSVVFILSDFLDMTEDLAQDIVRLSARSRTVRCGQILARSELTFPFEGALRFFDPETGTLVQTDAQRARALYQSALDALTVHLEEKIHASGGSFTRILTDEAPELSLSHLASGLAKEEG